jgi:hypothetical protein
MSPPGCRPGGSAGVAGLVGEGAAVAVDDVFIFQIEHAEHASGYLITSPRRKSVAVRALFAGCRSAARKASLMYAGGS